MNYKNLLLGFFIICIAIITSGIILSNIYYTKWIFYDAYSHIKNVGCKLDQCNVTIGTCYAYTHHDEKPYTCYGVKAVYTALINGKKYTNNVIGDYDWSGVYPVMCNKNTTECYYDDRDIQNTLTIFEICLLHWGDYSLWLFIFVISMILSVFLIILGIKCFQETIKDYTKIEESFQLVETRNQEMVRLV